MEWTFDDQLERNHAVHSSLDLRVQHVLRQEIQNMIRFCDAKGGAGIILDITSGEILAMVSLPDFDPNHNKKNLPELNATVSGRYEMGSTFKIFTVASALESGLLDLDRHFEVTPIKIDDHDITDINPQEEGPLTIREIFIKSLNTGAARIGEFLGDQHHQEFLARLRLLDTVSINDPDSQEQRETWGRAKLMTIAYGYGLAVSPLQLVNAVATVINGGFFRPPTLLKIDAPVQQDKPEDKRVLRAETSQALRQLMRENVDSQEGTGSEGKHRTLSSQWENRNDRQISRR